VGELTDFIDIVVSIAVIILLQLIGMVIFNWITPFRDMDELKKGNVAVGLALGGKFMSTAIILGVAAYTNTAILHMMFWFAVGYVCLVVAYLVFDLVTPGFKVSEQLQKGNVAVGILLSMVYIGTAFAISSLII
jgi:putative membrane protein